MQLHRYITRIHALVDSRREIDVEHLYVDEIVSGREAIIGGRLRFWDESLLEFVERVEMRGLILVKTTYAYHCQDAHAQLIFRYDNAPHHPEITTHPHHKHIADPGSTVGKVESATPPDLSDVLREIDQRLYT